MDFVLPPGWHCYTGYNHPPNTFVSPRGVQAPTVQHLAAFSTIQGKKKQHLHHSTSIMIHKVVCWSCMSLPLIFIVDSA